MTYLPPALAVTCPTCSAAPYELCNLDRMGDGVRVHGERSAALARRNGTIRDEGMHGFDMSTGDGRTQPDGGAGR